MASTASNSTRRSCTPRTGRSLTRFLADVCECPRTWTAASFVNEQIERIRNQVGEGSAICGLSGGVDSSVAALLVHRAIGDRLTCVFVDHGLMRKSEGEQVISAFRDTFKVPLVAVDAEERFLARLQGVTDPEAKRKAMARSSSACSRRRPRAWTPARARISWSRARSTPT